MIKSYRVAVVGATGLIGQELIKVLEQRNFPLADLRLYASDRSAGKRMFVGHRQIEVKEVENHAFREVDIALFSAGPEVSRYFAPQAVHAGATVIDNSTMFRMLPNVPLVVPEVNADDIKGHQGIIANPNCTVVQLVVALCQLHRVNPIKRIIVSTYQSVSGMGSPAVEELTTQTKQVLEGQTTAAHVFTHQIAFNLLPEIDVFLDNGYTREEWNMVEETRKIFHDPDLMMSATCVRVPVLIGHSEAVNVELAHPMTVDEARSVLTRTPGVRVLDDTSVSLYPQPWTVPGSDDVQVGRLRKDESYPTGLVMWIVADNVHRDIAVNMVQIAEEMTKRDWLKPRSRT